MDAIQRSERPWWSEILVQGAGYAFGTLLIVLAASLLGSKFRGGR